MLLLALAVKSLAREDGAVYSGTFNCKMLWAGIRATSCLLALGCVVAVSQCLEHGEGLWLKRELSFSVLLRMRCPLLMS